MKIYIASSWRHEHAVEMLTRTLEDRGCMVVSFVRNCREEPRRSSEELEGWFESSEAIKKFRFDTMGAAESDVVIYLGAAGTDAWAEIGIAWACGAVILGLWAKGEVAGLMRHMVKWEDDLDSLLATVDKLKCQ